MFKRQSRGKNDISLFWKFLVTFFCLYTTSLCAYHILKPLYINLFGKSATGKVVQITVNGGRKGVNTSSVSPVVSFTTPDNTQIKFTSLFVVSSISGSLIGTSVRVRYIASNPSIAEISLLSGIGIGSTVYYLFFLGVGIGLWVLLFYPPSKKKN